MALWSERQVKRDLGIKVHRPKPQSFDKLFQTPPHVEYIAREPKTAQRLRRLMGTNVVELSNCAYMDKLEHHTIRGYREDLQERMDERARQAAKLAHLQLWESVLRGQSSIPPEKLDDPCMRQVRQHQLKIEAIQQKADKLGTSVIRVAATPNVWMEPSRYKPPRRGGGGRDRSPLAGGSSATGHRRTRFGDAPSLHATSAPNMAAGGDMSSVAVGRATSWHSRRMVLKWSDEARAHRSRSATNGCAPAAGHQYRKLTGELALNVGYPRSLADKTKKTVTIAEGIPHHRDRRFSRINPPARMPVVFPADGPRLQLLSCDTEGGRVVMRQLGTSDFIIPVYFRPRALDTLRATKDLSELYQVGNSMFDGAYPAIDNRDWHLVFSRRAKKKLEQLKQIDAVYPIKTFRLVK